MPPQLPPHSPRFDKRGLAPHPCAMTHAWGFWLQLALNGAYLAGFYVTLALAFALLQGVTNRVFLSFGDISMFGAFAAVYAVLLALLEGYDELPALLIALPLSIAAAAALGRFIAAQAVLPLASGGGQAIMIASIGVSIALQEVMRLQSDARDQWLPPMMTEQRLVIPAGDFSVHTGPMQLLGLAAALLAVSCVVATLRFTSAGRFWRALQEDAGLATLCGLDAPRVVSNTVVASSALAAIAGWNIAVSYGGVSFFMGIVLGFKAMFASVIGGFGTVSGAIAGGLVLAAAETLWSAMFPLDYRDVAVFGLLIAILYLKPEGLLGHPIKEAQ
jgi:branched-chain amino acid transport system permease protein